MSPESRHHQNRAGETLWCVAFKSCLGIGVSPQTPTYFFCFATEKVQRSQVLASSPTFQRLATGTKRTRLRLKQLLVLPFASPGRYPSADARDIAALGAPVVEQNTGDCLLLIDVFTTMLVVSVIFLLVIFRAAPPRL